MHRVNPTDTSKKICVRRHVDITLRSDHWSRLSRSQTGLGKIDEQPLVDLSISEPVPRGHAQRCVAQMTAALNAILVIGILRFCTVRTGLKRSSVRELANTERSAERRYLRLAAIAELAAMKPDRIAYSVRTLPSGTM